MAGDRRLNPCHFPALALGTANAVPVHCSGRRPTLPQAPAWPDPAFRQVPGPGPRPGERTGAAQRLGLALSLGVSLRVSVSLCLSLFHLSASSSVFLCSSRSLFPPLFYSVCFCSCLYPSQFLFPFSSPSPSPASVSALGLPTCQALSVQEPWGLAAGLRQGPCSRVRTPQTAGGRGGVCPRRIPPHPTASGSPP